MESEILPSLAEKNKMNIFLEKGKNIFLDIGTPESYQSIQELGSLDGRR
jgi:NDP-sugar pyrophosphorylase family protein